MKKLKNVTLDQMASEIFTIPGEFGDQILHIQFQKSEDSIWIGC